MSQPRTASLSIARTLKATPEKVFAAWTQPEALKRWFGPGDAVAVRVEMDVRVGGRYSVVLRAASGEEHRVGGTYREVVAGRKPVFPWAWGTHPAARAPGRRRDPPRHRRRLTAPHARAFL